MPIDREATLRQAERLKSQGRLDLAIAEYVRLVEDQPRDWNALNALGDLYLHAGDVDRAVVQFVQIADHLFGEGFFPKAAALYKKALKAKPEHEHTLLRLAEISAAQEKLADARAYLRHLWERRSERGDDRGAAECLIRLAELPEADAETLLTGARASRMLDDPGRAARLFRAAAEQLHKAGRGPAALDALSQVVALDPDDVELRRRLISQYVAAGQIEDAGRLLDAETAGTDPDLLLTFAAIETTRRNDASARSTLTRFIALAPERSADVLRLAGELGRAGEPERAFACSEVVVDDAVLRGDWERAIDVLQSFLVHGQHIPALVKLVQIAVDAGHDDVILEARERLADAYLNAEQGRDAQAVAESLLAGAPDSAVHAGRLRRALELIGVDDPDEEIRRVRARYEPPPALIVEPDLAIESVTHHFEIAVDTPEIPIEPLPSFEVMTDLSESSLEAMPNGPDLSFDRFNDAPADSDSEDEVIELDVAAALPEVRDDSAAEVDLSAAITAMGTTTRAAVRKEPPALPSVADAAALLERGQQRLDTGQVREGLADLEQAARIPAFRFEAAWRLGREYAARGAAHAAIEWLERAAEAPAPSRDVSLAVLYELGVALEGVGERARALAVVMEVDSEEPGYRDIRPRLAVLARVEDESRG